MEPFINLVIRPPRADYTVEDLLEAEFSIKGRTYQRKDLEITNSRGHLLQCSHYVPLDLPEDAKLPCVIYCHGNSGCRPEGNEAAIVLLPSNITVFTLDFSGSGLSHGDFVSLGWNEKDDLKAAVQYLRSLKQVSCIGLWGRSMGAVTSLLYGAEDPSIAGMVLDSPFSNLFNLMMELADVYKIRLPKFTIRVALQLMRRIIQKRAQFDIMDMNVKQYASKTFVPALFGHAIGDVFIPPHHSDHIHSVYSGDKNIIKFEGNHNSPRPQFYYDSVTIFFHNTLSPPSHLLAEETCKFLAFGLNDLPSLHGLVEHSVSGALGDQVLRIQNSENAEGKESISQQETAINKLSESNSLKTRLEHPAKVIEFLRRKHNYENADLPSCDQSLESRGREQGGDCYSYPSSNGDSTEGWGRCSSHGISEASVDACLGNNSAETPLDVKEEKNVILRATTVSLKDKDSVNADETSSVQDCSVVTPRRKSRFDTLGRRLRMSCFRGMGKGNEEI